MSINQFETYSMNTCLFLVIKIQHLKLRQKSSIEMNRRLKWSQTPPNISDYDADCIKAPVFAPFQTTPRPADDACKAEKTSPDQGKGSSKGGQKDVVPPSKKGSHKQQPDCRVESGGFQPNQFYHSFF